ncbi:MAG TPA: hypothetical protein PLZ32_16680 [Saprospiraceae bacterium]|nr:hypothetical protein [Saprospiraceae bacterium]
MNRVFIFASCLLILSMGCELQPVDEWAEPISLIVNDTKVEGKVWAIKVKGSEFININISFQTESMEWQNFLSFDLHQDLVYDGAVHIIMPNDNLLDIKKDVQTRFYIMDNDFFEPTGALYFMDTLSINKLKFTDTKRSTLKFNIDVHFIKESDTDHTGTLVPGASELKISNISEINCPLKRQ